MDTKSIPCTFEESTNAEGTCSCRTAQTTAPEMTLVAVGGVTVFVCLWVLDELELVPAGRMRSRLVRPFVVVIIVTMLVAPAAWRTGFDWFVERKTSEVLDRIQPALEEIPPSSIDFESPLRSD